MEVAVQIPVDGGVGTYLVVQRNLWYSVWGPADKEDMMIRGIDVRKSFQESIAQNIRRAQRPDFVSAEARDLYSGSLKSVLYGVRSRGFHGQRMLQYP
jgi:hypothetical protein